MHCILLLTLINLFIIRKEGPHHLLAIVTITWHMQTQARLSCASLLSFPPRGHDRFSGYCFLPRCVIRGCWNMQFYFSTQAYLPCTSPRYDYISLRQTHYSVWNKDQLLWELLHFICPEIWIHRTETVPCLQIVSMSHFKVLPYGIEAFHENENITDMNTIQFRHNVLKNTLWNRCICFPAEG